MGGRTGAPRLEGEYHVVLSKAKQAVKVAARLLPPLQRGLDAYRRQRRLGELDAYIKAGRLLDAERLAELRADAAQICLDTQLSPAGLLNLELVARRMILLRQAGAFVECGTWRGGALAFFALSYRRQGGEPRRCPIFGFDSFQGMPRMTAADGAGASRWLYQREIDEIEPEFLNGALVGSEINRASADECRRVVRETSYPEDRVHIVPGWFQSTLPIWRDRIGPIAVLRIDGDFYESTRVCLETLYDQVIAGGVVIVDDYGTFEGCRRATDEFLASQPTIDLIPIDLSAVYFVKSR